MIMTGHVPDIRTKRVYDPPAADDGIRVLVDRLWPRGLSKDHAALTLWLKDIAPSPALRQWFGHDPARWEEFTHRYRRELASNKEAVKELSEYLREGRLTLLYGAHDTEHNHALVLSDYLRHHLKEA